MLNYSLKSRDLLVAGIDDVQFAIFQRLAETEGVIAGHTEDMARAKLLEAFNEVCADGGVGFGESPSLGMHCSACMIAERGHYFHAVGV